MRTGELLKLDIARSRSSRPVLGKAYYFAHDHVVPPVWERVWSSVGDRVWFAVLDELAK